MFIDLLFVIFMAYGAMKAFKGGIVASANGFLKIFLSLILGAKISYLFSGNVQDVTVMSASFVPLISFIIGFFALMILFRFMNLFFEAITGDYYGQWMTVSGIFSWLFFTGLGLSALVYWGQDYGMITSELTHYSKVYPYIADLYPIISCKLSYLWPAIDNMLNAALNILHAAGGSLKGECF